MSSAKSPSSQPPHSSVYPMASGRRAFWQRWRPRFAPIPVAGLSPPRPSCHLGGLGSCPFSAVGGGGGCQGVPPRSRRLDSPAPAAPRAPAPPKPTSLTQRRCDPQWILMPIPRGRRAGSPPATGGPSGELRRHQERAPDSGTRGRGIERGGKRRDVPSPRGPRSTLRRPQGTGGGREPGCLPRGGPVTCYLPPLEVPVPLGTPG